MQDLCNERDRDLILQVPLSSSNRPDSWYWLMDSKGVFTVKSCYGTLKGESRGQ